MKNPLLTSLLLLAFYAEGKAKKQQQQEQKQKSQKCSVTTLTEQEYKKTLSSDVAIIMISADFCSYCKGMKPTFDALAEGLGNSTVNFYLLDLGKSFEESQKSALLQRLEKEHNLSVSAIPQFIVFKNGVLMKEQCIGSQTQEQLKSFIQRFLS